MTKWHAHVAHMAKHINMVGGPDPIKSGPARKGHWWAWVSEEKAAFRRLKELSSTADVLAHFDPSVPSGVAWDASAAGIGATLFHRYSDGSERPIANISKTLTASQRNCCQIQKEALAIIYSLKKFFQHLYGRVHFGDGPPAFSGHVWAE